MYASDSGHLSGYLLYQDEHARSRNEAFLCSERLICCIFVSGGSLGWALCVKMVKTTWTPPEMVWRLMVPNMRTARMISPSHSCE
ncbi:hypothetical protein EUGRSUZ_C02965 [Eucalyptus grandis]|uniref:Uncharacterized protein n=2 Tax=Eucalyptus grandis TaxID=71139 RepID=A0ACC3LH51_EUCGR|nr:hypothetical protein EUGRSUZ_C02965 [Eucalyptus grandis]